MFLSECMQKNTLIKYVYWKKILIRRYHQIDHTSFPHIPVYREFESILKRRRNCKGTSLRTLYRLRTAAIKGLTYHSQKYENYNKELAKRKQEFLKMIKK